MKTFKSKPEARRGIRRYITKHDPDYSYQYRVLFHVGFPFPLRTSGYVVEIYSKRGVFLSML